MSSSLECVEYLPAIFIFMLISCITNWIGYKKKFYTLPKSPNVPNISLLQVLGCFGLYFITFLPLAHLFFRTGLTLFPSYGQTTIFALTQIISIFCFFFLWMFSSFFEKKAFYTLLKNRSTYPKFTLKQDFLIGASVWLLGAPITSFVGQTFDFIVCLLFGFTTYEQIAIHQLKEALHHPALLTSTLLAVLVSAPVIEEFLFRGILQNMLKQYVSRKSAIVIASFFFAFIHLSPAQGLGNISLFFSLFTFGCFLGFVYERQGSLLASIALHTTFNAITTLQVLSLSL